MYLDPDPLFIAAGVLQNDGVKDPRAALFSNVDLLTLAKLSALDGMIMILRLAHLKKVLTL